MTLRVTPPLQLPVALGRSWLRLPVALLIAGMSFAPLPPAVAHDLGIFGIHRDLLAMVIGAAPALTFRLAADTLVRPDLRRFE
ncbi:MAG TPA: hypothetical protein VGG62_00870 [Terracidiphilus sp.]